MHNYTDKNHLKYTLGGRLYGERVNSADKFSVSVGQVDTDLYNSGNYRSELRRTADLVYKDLGKDLVVFFSGGTDSEIVIRSFLEIGIKPTCAIIRFTNGYNLSDVAEAQRIADELFLDLEIIDFDVVEFYRSGEAATFGNALQCTQITYLTVYRNILKLSAPAVMGGEVVITRNIHTTPSTWYYTFRENEDASAMRFSDKYNLPLVNEWFSYTPELLLHYLEDEDIRELVTHPTNFKLTSVSSKNRILKKLYPDVALRIKTHGFERLQAFNLEAYRAIGSTQIKKLESSLDGIEINATIQMLKGNNGNN